MPNTPNQFPNIDLPGAEYFSLAPNASISIQGRRRAFNRIPPITVPASGGTANIENNFILESPFTPTSGIYVHAFFLSWLPLGLGLQINSYNSGISFEVAPFGADYPLGTPVLSNFAANISITMLEDRDKLIAARDIINVGGGPENRSILQFGSMINVLNSSPVAVQATSAAVLIYTRLDGLTE